MMDVALETDNDLENRARAQAEAIAQAQAIRFAEPAPMAALLQKVGLGKSTALPADFIPKPGRELLLWQLKRLTDLNSALQASFYLFQEASFVRTVPADRDCPIATYQARRKWNDAAKQWTELADPKAQTWLRCDRKLVLRRRGQSVFMIMIRKDLDVRFDPGEQKLVPVRVETAEPVLLAQIHRIIDWFPTLTIKQLSDGLRVPTRSFTQHARPRSAADAYVANAPLFATNMEAYMQDKKRPKEEKDDPNKGFVTWLSNTLRSSGVK